MQLTQANQQERALKVHIGGKDRGKGVLHREPPNLCVRLACQPKSGKMLHFGEQIPQMAHQKFVQVFVNQNLSSGRAMAGHLSRKLVNRLGILFFKTRAVFQDLAFAHA